jgi:nucleotide-binding universal stress UspA family protein
MHMSGTIVVGVDGSATARKAAEAARDLATALGATLHVVSAFDAERSDVFSSGGDKWLVSGIGRVLGSVASSVAHNAPCDVYIANTYDAD